MQPLSGALKEMSQKVEKVGKREKGPTPNIKNSKIEKKIVDFFQFLRHIFYMAPHSC